MWQTFIFAKYSVSCSAKDLFHVDRLHNELFGSYMHARYGAVNYLLNITVGVARVVVSLTSMLPTVVLEEVMAWSSACCKAGLTCFTVSLGKGRGELLIIP